MKNDNSPAKNSFDYQRTESSRLRFFRRWTTALAIASGTLLIVCLLSIIGVMLLAQTESRLTKENDNLKQQIATIKTIRDSEKTTGNSDQSLIKNLDTTKLLTKNDVGENQIPDHFLGRQNAQVVVIEYADFACSACQGLHARAAQIHKDYGDKALFINRSFSLGFPNSEITLAAAEAAYLVGGETAYHQMADMLYGDTTWSRDEINQFLAITKVGEYAAQIGLDTTKFNEALSARADNGIMTKIARDKESGQAAGVKATPTWLINGQKVEGANATSMQNAIEAALAETH